MTSTIILSINGILCAYQFQNNAPQRADEMHKS